MNTITLQELQTALPQAFVKAPSRNVSSKYSFIPTHQILGDLDKLGWKIREIVNPRYKSMRKQLHGKHLIRLFNPNLHISSGEDKNYVEIALYNSSDGLSRFRMEVGIFRFVCENGLVVKTEDFGSINMRHSGYSFESLKESIDQMIERLPQVVTKINAFTGRILTPVEMYSLAEEAYSLRNSGRKATEDEIHALLSVRRDADKGNNLWVVGNRIQESILRGGQMTVDSRGRIRTAKPIRNLDKSLKLNQGVWELMEKYAQ